LAQKGTTCSKRGRNKNDSSNEEVKKNWNKAYRRRKGKKRATYENKHWMTLENAGIKGCVVPRGGIRKSEKGGLKNRERDT